MIWDLEKGIQDRLIKLFISKLRSPPAGGTARGRRRPAPDGVGKRASNRQDGFARSSGRDDAAAIAPDGQTIASTGGSTAVHCWDVKSHQDRLAVATAHSDAINSVLFADDGKRSSGPSDDETARIWDVESGRQKRVMKHVRRVSVMALAPVETSSHRRRTPAVGLRLGPGNERRPDNLF